MAFCYNSETPVTYSSPLARAEWSRKKDVYVLATRYRNADMRRTWDDYARELPGEARLVAADCESDREEAARATAKVDKRLRRAEGMLVKSKKPNVTKARKSGSVLADPELDAVLRIDNPERREFEYRRLCERRVQAG